jgi:3-hydroxyisobutyrate dehydrogenase
MGPQHTLESTGIMLVSGERSRVERLKPALALMTGKLVDLGDRPDAAASFKLMGNFMLMFITAGLTDMLALAQALHVPPAEAATLLDHFNPAMTLPARLERMISGRFDDPAWELSMARKDVRLMMEEAARGGVTLGALPAIGAMMDAAIAEGHGEDDWTVLAKDVVS